MPKHKKKVKRKHMLQFLSLLRDYIKREMVLSDEEDLPARREQESGTTTTTTGSTLPPAVLRALRIGDEFTSGVNGDVSRLRDAIRTALSVVGSDSVSGEAPVANDLGTSLAKASDHDLGFQLAASEGYDGPPPEGVTFPESFEEGQKKGLKNYKPVEAEEEDEEDPPPPLVTPTRKRTSQRVVAGAKERRKKP